MGLSAFFEEFDLLVFGKKNIAQCARIDSAAPPSNVPHLLHIGKRPSFLDRSLVALDRRDGEAELFLGQVQNNIFDIKDSHS